MKLFLHFVIYLQRFAGACDDTVSPTDTGSHPTANRCKYLVYSARYGREAFLTASTLLSQTFFRFTHTPVTARQAPFSTPIAVARDPLSRGIYLVDEADNGSLIRFLNTGATTATVAGKTIEAGNVRRLAGDSGEIVSQNDWDIPISTVAFAARGLAVSSAGALLYFSDVANSRVWAYGAGDGF